MSLPLDLGHDLGNLDQDLMHPDQDSRFLAMMSKILPKKILNNFKIGLKIIHSDSKLRDCVNTDNIFFTKIKRHTQKEKYCPRSWSGFLYAILTKIPHKNIENDLTSWPHHLASHHASFGASLPLYLGHDLASFPLDHGQDLTSLPLDLGRILLFDLGHDLASLPLDLGHDLASLPLDLGHDLASLPLDLGHNLASLPLDLGHDLASLPLDLGRLLAPRSWPRSCLLAPRSWPRSCLLAPRSWPPPCPYRSWQPPCP